MTLEEEIKRFTDNAEYERTHGNLQGCLEFKQLADWLKELKQLREQESVLDKIRAEIEQTAKDYDKFDDYRRVRGLWIALEIIDKYKAESEG